MLNTKTEVLYHLPKDPVYKTVYASGLGITEDARGNFWLFNKQGGLYIFNLTKHTLRSYSEEALGRQNNKIMAMASKKSKRSTVD